MLMEHNSIMASEAKILTSDLKLVCTQCLMYILFWGKYIIRNYLKLCMRMVLWMGDKWLAGCLPTGISGVPDVRFIGSASSVTEEEGTVTVCAVSGQLTEGATPVTVRFTTASGTAQGKIGVCQTDSYHDCWTTRLATKCMLCVWQLINALGS